MRYFEFPSLTIANRIRRLHFALQKRRTNPDTRTVVVWVTDLEYVLDHLKDLEEYKTEIEELFEQEIIS